MFGARCKQLEDQTGEKQRLNGAKDTGDQKISLKSEFHGEPKAPIIRHSHEKANYH
jgi:hypothetical protein